jgi:hypothetical protein
MKFRKSSDRFQRPLSRKRRNVRRIHTASAKLRRAISHQPQSEPTFAAAVLS